MQGMTDRAFVMLVCSGIGEFQRFGRTAGSELHITVTTTTTTTTTACTIHELLRVLDQFGYRHAFREIDSFTPAFPLQQNYVGATTSTCHAD
jgi:hypothetical protein